MKAAGIAKKALAGMASLALAVGLCPSLAVAAEAGDLQEAPVGLVAQGHISGSTNLDYGYYFKYKGAVEVGLDDIYFVADGGTVTPQISVWYISDQANADKETLDPSKYTLVIEKPNDSFGYDVVSGALGDIGEGSYRVTATAKEGSGLVGSVTGYFKVCDTKNLEGAEVEFDDRYYDSNEYDYVIPAGEKPSLVVTINGASVPPSAYKISYYDRETLDDLAAFPTVAGRYMLTLEGVAPYKGSAFVTFIVSGVASAQGTSIAGATIAGVLAKTYTGKGITQNLTVKVGSTTLKGGTDYTVSYKNNVNAGTATVTVTGKGNYTGTKSATFKINKAAAKAKATTSKTYKASALKKKAQSFTAVKLTTDGKATYSVAKKDLKKKLTSKGGKVTVKKGTKKGTYTIKVKAAAKAGKNYNAFKAKTYTIKVKVK